MCTQYRRNLTVRQGNLLIDCEEDSLGRVIQTLHAHNNIKQHNQHTVPDLVLTTVQLAQEIQQGIANLFPDCRVATLAGAVGLVRRKKLLNAQMIKRLQNLNAAASWLRHSDNTLVHTLHHSVTMVREAMGACIYKVAPREYVKATGVYHVPPRQRVAAAGVDLQ